MTDNQFPSGKLLQMLRESSRRGSQLHEHFLDTRRHGLHGLRSLIETQINAAFVGDASVPAATAALPAIFDSQQLDQFGTGKMSACLGPAFARYDDRRIPRIPNGDLKMMSRIVAISGTPRDFSQPASVSAEYDVPVDAWYLRDNGYPEIPTALFMEIALQPCGFLSAYLDTYAFVPYEAYYFRNLDGSLRFFNPIDLRGKTITTRARLINSVVSGGSVIQKYGYEISCADLLVCAGESTFGYFSAETMANQVGLDGGRAVLPNPGTVPASAPLDLSRLQVVNPAQPFYHLANGRLHYLDTAQVLPGAGNYGKGYVYASRAVDPDDWFFPFHFYQDPVMPGSLGIEAMIEALQAFAIHSGLGRGLRSPRFSLTSHSVPTTWRYRGQITRQHQRMELEVHLSGIEQDPDSGLLLTADASLWVDGLRIYELKNAAIRITEA